MEFGLLGPPEIRGPRGQVRFRSHRLRAVLATLALHANRAVAVDRLIDVVWPHRPPPTAQAQIQKAICALRSLLAGPTIGTVGGAADGRIDTVFPGYLLRAGPGEVDADAFQDEAQVAFADLGRGEVQRAVAGYHRALDRWFGRALDGVPGLAADATFLEERRLLVLESCLCGELLLGRRADLSAELARLTTVHPLRERLRALQMIVLHLCGRRADALRVYHQTRHLLADELGMEPGAELRDVARLILSGSPEDPLAMVADWIPAAPVAVR
jgi:DNA-binding SARP family transcriptional activator